MGKHRWLRGILWAGAISCAPSALAAGGAGAEAPAQAGSAQPDLADIIVTATKRPEIARQISGSISAISGAQLETLGAQQLEDYLGVTPGVVFNPVIPGFSSVIVRGVATTTIPGGGQGTTGYFINDVPLTDPYFSVGIPDIDAFDVANVSILRGPQGTLFGSASLGGAINYQAAPADLHKIGMHVQATVSDTEHGEAGGAAKVMINLPVVADKLGIRGVLTYRRDAGYVDNLGTGQAHSNRTNTIGGRIEVAFEPGPDTSLRYLFLRQDQKTLDTGDTDPTLGQLTKNSLIAEPSKFDTTIHNLRLDQDAGFATITAMATLHIKGEDELTDFTSTFGPILQGAVAPFSAAQLASSRGSSFEIRLASPTGPGHPFEYLIGVMHDDTKEHILTNITGPGVTQAVTAQFGPIFGPNAALSAPNDTFFVGDLHFRGLESAAFGEATYHFTDQFKLTVGGRLFRTALDTLSDQHGFLQLLSSGAITQIVSGPQHESGFSPKASITWSPDADFRAYALVSKGFRYGGANVNPPDPTYPTPAAYNSDSLINYELGIRSNWFGRRLKIDLTGFYVDWSDIALTLSTPRGFQYVANAGKAHNYGFESSITISPSTMFSLQTNITYLDAKLARAFSPGPFAPTIAAGTTLPGASKWQISNIVDLHLSSSARSPDIIVEQRYISSAPGLLGTPSVQGGYNLVDARLRVPFERFSLTGFIQNLGDVRGVATSVINQGMPQRWYIVRPRTIGVTFDLAY